MSIALPKDLRSMKSHKNRFTDLSEEFKVVSDFCGACFHVILIILVQSRALKLLVKLGQNKIAYHIENIVDVKFS